MRGPLRLSHNHSFTPQIYGYFYNLYGMSPQSFKNTFDWLSISWKFLHKHCMSTNYFRCYVIAFPNIKSIEVFFYSINYINSYGLYTYFSRYFFIIKFSLFFFLQGSPRILMGRISRGEGRNLQNDEYFWREEELSNLWG